MEFATIDGAFQIEAEKTVQMCRDLPSIRLVQEIEEGRMTCFDGGRVELHKSDPLVDECFLADFEAPNLSPLIATVALEVGRPEPGILAIFEPSIPRAQAGPGSLCVARGQGTAVGTESRGRGGKTGVLAGAVEQQRDDEYRQQAVR